MSWFIRSNDIVLGDKVNKKKYFITKLLPFKN